MIHRFEAVRECSSSCDDELRNKLSGLKLIFSRDDKTANGAITITHAKPPKPHTIIVEVYESDESPNGSHECHMKRPSVIPTKDELLKKLKKEVSGGRTV